MGERDRKAVLFVLFAVFVILLSCAASAFAVNSHTVSVEFYDYNETDLSPYTGDNQNLWVYLEISDKTSGECVGWSVQQFNPRSANPSELTFNNFGSISNSGYPDNSISFDSEQYDVTRVRLYSSSPTYHLVHDDLQFWESRPNDTVDGTKFMD